MNGFKLKRYISAIMAGMLTLVVAPGCVATYDDLVPEETGKDNGEFTVTVEAHDFDTEDPKTRAVQNGSVMRFDYGDALGLTFLDAQGNIVANSDNVKYTYDGNTRTWITSGSPDFSKASRYIAYFPYNASCNGCKTESDVLAKLPVNANQSSKENYHNSDVLFAEDVASRHIKIKFKHSRVCISFSVVSPVQGFNYSGDLNIASKLTSLTLSSTSDNNGYPSSFYYKDGVYYGIFAPKTTALSAVINLFSTSKTLKLTSSGSYSYQAGKRYHNIIKYTANNNKLTPQLVQGGDYIMKNGTKLEVVPAQLLGSAEDDARNGKIYGQVAHVNGNTITSVGFYYHSEFNSYSCGYYVYSENYNGNTSKWYPLHQTLPHHQKVYSTLSYSGGQNYDQWGPYDMTVLDGRTGIQLTNTFITTLNANSQKSYLIDIINTLNNAKSAFNSFSNVTNVYYPGDIEVNYPNVGGHACVSAGERYSWSPLSPRPLVVRAGGNGSLHLESCADGTITMKVLVNFTMS